MNWLHSLKNLLGIEGKASRTDRTGRRCLSLEYLETRLVPYSVTGNLWPHPNLVTLSFVPDGTLVSTNGSNPVASNLFAAFNANPHLVGQWQTQILKAAEAWAAQTNINIAVVGDNGTASGGGNYQQGDPGMGDIRISGYNFGNSVLGEAVYPPPANNYSIAGDIAFNTGQTFNINATYDLFSVAAHELGHALGLGETGSTYTSAVMYPSYNGVKHGLASDDIAGIRNIYSSNNPRSYDAFYGSPTPNNSFANAANLNSYVNPTTLTAQLPNLDITTASEAEYFTFTAPANTSGTLQVNVQSTGLSLLSPKVTVYAADQQTVLGSANGYGQAGATLSVTVSGISAGQQFYVKVQTADTSVFSVGAYALTLNMGGGATPAVTPPNTQVLNGNPLTGGGGVANAAANGDTFDSPTPVILGVTPDTGSSDSNAITAAQNISLYGTAPGGDTVQVYMENRDGSNRKLLGTTVADASGLWTFDYTGTTLAAGTYFFTATAIDGGNLSDFAQQYMVVIDLTTPNPPALTGVTPDAGAGTTAAAAHYTNVSTPTLAGTADPNTTISVYANGRLVGTAAADSLGNWQLTSKSLSDGAYAFTATATEVAGNVSGLSAPLTVVIDTDAPAAPVISGVSEVTNNLAQPTLVVGGTAEAGSTVTLYLNGNPVGTATADGSGNWNYAFSNGLSFASGSYPFTATATDLAGNVSAASAPFNLLLGNPSLSLALPQITIGSVGDLLSQASSVTLSGYAKAGMAVNVVDGDTILGTAVADAKGKWSFRIPVLASGTHSLAVFATDALGNEGLLTDALLVQI